MEALDVTEMKTPAVLTVHLNHWSPRGTGYDRRNDMQPSFLECIAQQIQIFRSQRSTLSQPVNFWVRAAPV